MRFSRVAVLALVLGMTLSGCHTLNTLGSAADEVDISNGLEALEAELEGIPGVTGATSSMPMEADLKFVVSVAIDTDGLDSDGAQAVVAAVSDTFAGEKFLEQPNLSFTIASATDPIVNIPQWIGLPTEELAAQFQYLFELQAVYGEQLAMDLLLVDPTSDGVYQRSITAATAPTTVDWAAMRAVPDSTTADPVWMLPGAYLLTTLPPERLDTLVEAVGEADVAGSATVTWFGADDTFTLSVVPDVLAADSFTDLEAWDTIVALLEQAASPGLGLKEFAIAEDGRGAVVHTGSCDVPVTKRDTQLAKDLEASGITLAPGTCTIH